MPVSVLEKKADSMSKTARMAKRISNDNSFNERYSLCWVWLGILKKKIMGRNSYIVALVFAFTR